ncbi:MAG: MATE family efflux transporter [Gammaproteobacteria bacterium]|nr:MATE family efflux transporter [Gammaproteobacteria bacterium]
MTDDKPPRHVETRTVIAISGPLMAAYVAEMGMMITDMIIVGRLGANELAAVGLTADWFYVLLLIGMGIISIVGVLAAQSLGEGNSEGITSASEQGMIAATIAAVPVMLSVWYLAPALNLTDQDPDVIRLIREYSRPLTWSVLPALWFAVLRNYVTAMAKASIIMTITVAALALNAALNYTLVFGKFGMPALGVVGAAYGTTIVNWIMFAALAWHVMRSPRFKAYRPSIFPRRIEARTLREIFVLGMPITFTQILNGAMFTVAAVMTGVLGADVLAAQQIVYAVIYFALSAAIALADAARVRVAYGIGRRSVAAARQSAHITFLLAAIISAAAAATLWLIPEQIVSIFLDTSQPANVGVMLIAISLSLYAAVFQALDGVLIVMANAVRGLRDTKSPLWISMAGYWLVGLGSGTILCFGYDLGAKGLWQGLIAGPLVAIVLMFLRFRLRMREAEARLGPA